MEDYKNPFLLFLKNFTENALNQMMRLWQYDYRLQERNKSDLVLVAPYKKVCMGKGGRGSYITNMLENGVLVSNS